MANSLISIIIMTKNEKELGFGSSLHSYAKLIIFSNTFFLIAALIFYNGHFNFWLDPFSNLGDAVNNVISARIFTAEMVINGLIFAYLARNYLSQNRTTFNRFNTILCIIACAGFFIGGFSPDDTMHTGHVVGMALAVASLWLWLNSILLERRGNFTKRRFKLLEFFLEAPILLYASAYFLQIDPASYAFQKGTLFSLALVLYSATK